jgi:hypothetical protein
MKLLFMTAAGGTVLEAIDIAVPRAAVLFVQLSQAEMDI